RSSACSISSMDSLRATSASRWKPQFSRILEWMKYWLMAVSSAVRISLRTSMISGSPFMWPPCWSMNTVATKGRIRDASPRLQGGDDRCGGRSGRGSDYLHRCLRDDAFDDRNTAAAVAAGATTVGDLVD